MTPLERMARAICGHHAANRLGGPQWPPGEFTQWVDMMWRTHLPAARVALTAIEEPSEAMENAARWALFKWREKSGDSQAEAPPGEKHRIRYRAMIRAASEEGP